MSDNKDDGGDTSLEERWGLVCQKIPLADTTLTRIDVVSVTAYTPSMKNVS